MKKLLIEILVILLIFAPIIVAGYYWGVEASKVGF